MADQKYRILIVTGIITSEHDPKVNEMLRRTLESTGRFVVKITEEFKGSTDKTLEGYDAVLLNYDGKTDVTAPYIPLGKDAEDVLCTFVSRGGGIIMYHSSAIAEAGEYPEEFVKMIGGAFKFSDGGRKNPKLAFRVDTVKGDPICEDVPDHWYTAQDDLFINIRWQSDSSVRVLATVDDCEEDYDIRKMQKHLARDYAGLDISKLEKINQPHPVMWTNTYGKGRVFVPFIGHGMDTIRRPEFDCLFVRGCEWACCGNVTIPYPDIQEERRFAAWPYYDNISITTLADLTRGL